MILLRNFAAPISSNTRQHLGGEQQHRSLPCPDRHDVQLPAVKHRETTALEPSPATPTTTTTTTTTVPSLNLREKGDFYL